MGLVGEDGHADFRIGSGDIVEPAIEALRGSARPGRGHASDAKRIGTRAKRGLRGNYIMLLLKSVELEVVGNCAVLPEF